MASTRIADILRMRPGSGRQTVWIEDDFEAVVRDVKDGRSSRGPYWRATLVDPHDSRDSIEAMSDADLSRYDGRHVRFSGKGIKRAEYQGKDQVGIGKAARIDELGAGSSQSSSRSSNSQGSSSNSAPANSAPYIKGESIGNAMTNAVMAVCTVFPNLKPGTRDWITAVYTVSSDLLRVNLELQGGKLVRRASEREAKQEKQQQEPPQQEKKAEPPAPPKDIDEEDVPF